VPCELSFREERLREPALADEGSSSPDRVPLVFVRNPRARRYLLRVRPDGSAHVTIPRRGSATAARAFATRQAAWIEQQLQRLQASRLSPVEWSVGSPFLYRGEQVRIEADVNGDCDMVRFSDQRVPMKHPCADLRPLIELHLRHLASQELPMRLLHLAASHGLSVKRVNVRSQRSRWGSCSRRGTISLNWRLIQMPPYVRDYILLHELAHLREMNHSLRFWREVERLCPDYKMAKSWLRSHAALLW